MEKEISSSEKWAKTVILVDAKYLDQTTFDLIVNFERMINRRIPQADLCQWLDCVALDGGLLPGDNEIQVLFVHPKEMKKLDNFCPANFEEQLDAKAFKDKIGEFQLSSFATEDVISLDALYLQSLEAILEQESIEHILLIPNIREYGMEIHSHLSKAKREKDITLFAMEPVSGIRQHQEILGYSLMNALGIKAKELE